MSRTKGQLLYSSQVFVNFVYFSRMKSMKNRFLPLILIYVVFPCYFLFIFVNKFDSSEEQQNKESVLQKNNQPHCHEKLLSNKDYLNWKMRFYKNNNFKHQQKSCKLVRYMKKYTVTCLENIYLHHSRYGNSSTMIIPSESSDKELHFVFIGDSRIRQQFFNFLNLIPNYDRITNPSPIPFAYHGDIEVTSRILKLRISFYWYPLIDNNFMRKIRQWAIPNTLQQPYLVVLSIAVWHMMQNYGADYLIYKKKLLELGPIIGQLANFSQVIWLNQYPTIEKYGNNYAHNTDIHTEKIHHYNEAIRQLFEKQGAFRIWDSSNSFAEEYVRGCAIFHRSELDRKFLDYATAYVNCDDFIHTGYSALSLATQLLYNDICNAHILGVIQE